MSEIAALIAKKPSIADRRQLLRMSSSDSSLKQDLPVL